MWLFNFEHTGGLGMVAKVVGKEIEDLSFPSPCQPLN